MRVTAGNLLNFTATAAAPRRRKVALLTRHTRQDQPDAVQTTPDRYITLVLDIFEQLGNHFGNRGAL